MLKISSRISTGIFFFINFPDRFLSHRRYTYIPYPFNNIPDVDVRLYHFFFIRVFRSPEDTLLIPYRKIHSILPYVIIICINEFPNHGTKSFPTISMDHCDDKECLLIHGNCYSYEIAINCII